MEAFIFSIRLRSSPTKLVFPAPEGAEIIKRMPVAIMEFDPLLKCCCGIGSLH
jgi:hypothetical protein